MKKSTKIILLILTFLLPLFILLFGSGFYTQLFFGGGNQLFSLQHNDPNYIIQSRLASFRFISVSISLFMVSYIVIFIIYSLNLIKRIMKTEEKVFWFILFMITMGIGMLFYFFKYIWKDGTESIDSVNLQPEALK